jgi:hypothetical protein
MNSMIVFNKVGTSGSGPTCAGSFSSGGNNLISSSDLGCTGFASKDFEGDPLVGKLANNGGPTKTIALEKGSFGINRANPATAEKRDQRGYKRDSKPDIGAYEYGAKP